MWLVLLLWYQYYYYHHSYNNVYFPIWDLGILHCQLKLPGADLKLELETQGFLGGWHSQMILQTTLTLVVLFLARRIQVTVDPLGYQCPQPVLRFYGDFMEPRVIWAALVRLVRRNTPNLVETPRLLWWQRGHGWVCEHRVALRGQLPQDSTCPVNCPWVELWFWNFSIKNTKSKSTSNCPFWAVVALNHLFLADPGYSLGAIWSQGCESPCRLSSGPFNVHPYQWKWQYISCCFYLTQRYWIWLVVSNIFYFPYCNIWDVILSID